jgi:hypothetical protein
MQLRRPRPFSGDHELVGDEGQPVAKVRLDAMREAGEVLAVDGPWLVAMLAKRDAAAAAQHELAPRCHTDEFSCVPASPLPSDPHRVGAATQRSPRCRG